MAVRILMPALSPTMTEGNLARWLVKEGDAVNPGDVLAEIETDKATMEVEAVDAGTVGRLVVPEGTEGVQVNATIGILLEEGEAASALDAVDPASGPAGADGPQAPPPGGDAPAGPPSGAAVARAPGGSAEQAAATPLARRIARQAGLDLSSVSGTGDRGRIVKADVEEALGGRADAPGRDAGGAPPGRQFASPRARRVAAEAGVDLSGIAGSGPGGRVVRRDVEAALAAAPAPEPAAAAGSELVDLSAMRKVIARRMTESKSRIPHFYMTIECEIDELLSVRKSLNAAPPEPGLSINDFVVRACALALMEVPEANVAWEDEKRMRRFLSADVAVAVALDEGLVTPVVRAAETKGLAELSAEVKSLAARAREGRLAPDEYQGGGFTISNLGMYGIRQFDAVINPPQACILAVGAGERRPVVRDGEIVPATVMCCTLSVDHRLVDGAIGSRFLAAVRRYVEYPPAMLL